MWTNFSNHREGKKVRRFVSSCLEKPQNYKLFPGRSEFGEFPWQGIIFVKERLNYVGTGVLIDQRHFLTVAYRIGRFP